MPIIETIVYSANCDKCTLPLTADDCPTLSDVVYAARSEGNFVSESGDLCLCDRCGEEAGVFICVSCDKIRRDMEHDSKGNVCTGCVDDGSAAVLALISSL